jgi:hypothetical protein
MTIGVHHILLGRYYLLLKGNERACSGEDIQLSLLPSVANGGKAYVSDDFWRYFVIAFVVV